jgi:hypothetical protein
MHGRYGDVSLNGHGKRGIAHEISEKFYELPISNLVVSKPFSSLLSAIRPRQNGTGFVLPWGGGGYFRLIPWWIFKKGIRRILSQKGVYLFYMHPWEIDPEQPKVKDAPRFFRFRHYVNLGKTEQRLIAMLRCFEDCRFLTCNEYLREIH